MIDTNKQVKEITYNGTTLTLMGSKPAVIEPLTITENNTYTAPEGVDGYNPITVNVHSLVLDPVLQDKTIKDNGVYTADEGYDGLGTVTVDITTGCDPLVTGTLTSYESDITEIRDYAFMGAENLTTVNLPYVTKVGNHCFDGCTSLETVNLPLLENEEYEYIYLFNGCVNLTSVNIPLLISISHYAFSGCTSLKTIDLPEVKSIGPYCFTNSGIKTLILRFEGDWFYPIVGLDSYALDGTPIAQGTGYIYVPAALIERYKANSAWSTYANQFRALESYTVDGTITGELDPNKI